tara:strand:- start:1653 stop:2216 length:564 start_codon:yes stop_codon:yes gene_type:complete
MLSLEELLELRKQIKSKKPNFIRQDYHKKKRLGKKWRRPKGLQSKIRLKFRGRAKKVSLGYGSPRKARHMHKSGLKPFIVKSAADLERSNPKENILIIASPLGDKKRISIMRKAKEGGFTISNFKDPEGYITKIEDKIRLRKELKKGKGKKKEVKAEEKKEKLTEKAEEDKKGAEKREKDKVLTKRG